MLGTLRKIWCWASAAAGIFFLYWIMASRTKKEQSTQLTINKLRSEAETLKTEKKTLEKSSELALEKQKHLTRIKEEIKAHEKNLKQFKKESDTVLKKHEEKLMSISNNKTSIKDRLNDIKNSPYTSERYNTKK